MKRILLVDDNPMQRKLSCLLLGAAGFAVDSAAGTEEALEALRRCPPDAILSDVLMGDVDGFGLCRRVRQMPQLRSVPVVLTSAQFNQAADRQLAVQVGANELVTRTPDLHSEIAAIQRSLEDGAQAAQLPDGPDLAGRHLRLVSGQLSSAVARASSSEQRYQTLLDNAHDAICLVDLQGFVIHANKRWAQIRKASSESMRGAHIDSFAAPGYVQSNLAEFKALLAAGAARTAVPVAIAATDGAVTLMEFSGNVVEIDGEQVVLTIGRDITDSVRMLTELKDSEERYRQLVERLPDLVWSITSAAEISFISPKVHHLCGVTADQVTAMGLTGWLDRVHPDCRVSVEQAHLELLSGERSSLDVKYRWKKNDGTFVWLHSRSSARYQANGVMCCDGVLIDITEQRLLEEKLLQSQKMEAVGQLAGGVAHDFNNLLTVIMANAYFLATDLDESDPRRQQADQIHEASERAAALTRQLLSFSRKQVLRPEPLKADEVVAHLCKMLRRLIDEDVCLTLQGDAELGSVMIDRGQLEQVIINLAVNARDAMPNGGALTIATNNRELQTSLHTETGELPPGQYVTVSVSDAGTGIEAAVRSRIFEPFFTTKSVGRGTGLGLSTVHEIVTQASGAIAIDSTLGHGTCFTVYLPRTSDEAPTNREERPLRRPLRGTESILLVEDEELLGQVARRILQSAGYEVFSARDGEQALALLRDAGNRVRLVVTDVVMPNTNGPQLVAAMRAQQPDLKVLYMSGYIEQALLNAKLLDAKEQLLQKPFTSMDLLTKVRQVLSAVGEP